REHLAPLWARDQPRQCREPQPVARLVADAAELAAQDRVLVPQDQELGILGHLTPGQHHEAAEQAAHKQVDGREDHSGMISPRKAPPATPDRVIEPHKLPLAIRRAYGAPAAPGKCGGTTADAGSAFSPDDRGTRYRTVHQASRSG